MNSIKSRELKALFLQDGGKILRFLRGFIDTFDAGVCDGEKVNQCFRHVHSLKSEASFLGYSEIVHACENLEGTLATLRSLNSVPEGREADDLRGNLTTLARDTASIIKSLHIELSQESEVSSADAGDGKFAANEFESVVLKEARNRGERLYRISAVVDDSEPMPYPRLYLLVNNLELYDNLVRIMPPLDVLEKGETFSAALYITSRRDSVSIRGNLDVDGIRFLNVEEASYADVLPDESEDEPVRGEPNSPSRKSRYREEPRKSVSLDRSAIELFSFYLDYLSSGAGGESLPIKALKAMARKNGGASCSLVFEKASRMAEDLAAGLGKKVRIEIRLKGEPFFPAGIQEAINEILTHLIRNVVDHGIGLPGEREGMGKPPEGRVLLEGQIEAGTCVVRVADDGVGIREDEIRETAAELGIVLPEGSGLLAYLTHPGLSTRRNASPVSGRGVGLDVVQGLARNILGGELELTTEIGKGTAFTLVFSENNFRYPSWGVRIGKKLLKVPRAMVEEVFAFNAASVEAGESPAYRLGGARHPVHLFNKQTRLHDGEGLLIRAAAEPFIILADEAVPDKFYSMSELYASVSILLKAAFRE